MEAVARKGINAGYETWDVPFTFQGDPTWVATVQRGYGKLIIMWVGPKEVARRLFGFR